MAGTDPRVVVIFGGRSEIGVELAVRLAAGAVLVLARPRADPLHEEVAAVARGGGGGGRAR
ncbi:oxidoreductase, partial [Mycolicibacterium porcinum]